jgi:outer membrane protein assembly factor BamB
MKTGKLALISLLLFALVNLPFHWVLAQNSYSSWPVFRYDTAHTSLSSFVGPTEPQVLWTVDLGESPKGGPATLQGPVIGQDGTIYFGFGCNLYAINPDGSKKWEFATGSDIGSISPAIGKDGTIYIGSRDNNLYAVNPDGSKKWAFTANGPFSFSSPSFLSDGTILILSNDGYLYAINPDGSKEWDFKLNLDFYFFSPVVGPDDTIYVATKDEVPGYGGVKALYLGLCAIRPNGTKAWFYPAYAEDAVAVGKDGTIYLGTFLPGENNNAVMALTPEGNLKWSYPLGGITVIGLALGPDGSIYVGPRDHYIYALSQDGQLKWKFETGDKVVLDPIVDANGTIYVFSTEGWLYALNLYALNPDGSLRWKLTCGYNCGSASPVLGANGVLYVCADKLYAIGDKSIPTIFSDTPSDYWASSEISDLAQTGIIKGYPDGTFKPENPVTRAEFAKMALLSLGLKEEQPENPTFPDVPKDHWAYSYVEGAVKAGLIKGYPDGTFKPDGQVTKAEEMTVIVRGKKWETGTPSEFHFSDCQADTWFAAYVESALAQGIVKIPDPNIVRTENDAPKFDPNAPATRAQTAVFLARMRAK